MSTQSALLKIMSDAARKAAKGLIRDFGELDALQVSRKGLGDFVTAADIKAEQVIFEALSAARPGYGFLGEERGMVEGSDKTHTWIVDPLDGTTNFLHALPHFAVNIALRQDLPGQAPQVIAGVTFNPITQELFWAERGKGCFVNDRRLRVAGRKRLEDTLVATGIPFAGRPGHAQFLKELHALSQRVAGVRRYGSAALDLAFVAAGRFDAYWERNLKPWDLAAGLIMITEAGGTFASLDEGHVLDTGTILAGNMDLQPQFTERLKAVA